MTFQKIIILCAGFFLEASKKTKMMSKVKREPGRKNPSDAAATAEAARRDANQVIMNVLNQAGASGSSTHNQQETMDVVPGNASSTYRNFLSEGAADGAHPLHGSTPRRGVTNQSKFSALSEVSMPRLAPVLKSTASRVAASTMTGPRRFCELTCLKTQRS
jgi:hypothetical protein